MPKLKYKFIRYLIVINLLVSILILIATLGIRTMTAHSSIRENAAVVFRQIDQILTDNEKQLQDIREEYRVTYENKARSAAYMFENDPDLYSSQEELLRAAKLLEVDEIHLFDDKGVIFVSTDSEYIGVSMDDGEQIAFFKPMLEDKSLFLIQDIEPNSADQRQMQYSAVWSENGKFIVQIGMEPTNVLRVYRNNTLPHVFSLVSAGVGVDLYAIDSESGVIEGSTVSKHIGKTISEIGIPKAHHSKELYAEHSELEGVYSYCVFTEIRGKEIAYVVPRQAIYADMLKELAIMAVSMIFISAALVLAVMWYINRFVIRTIRRINDSLTEISMGKLDTKVEEGGTCEFAELSSHINDLINSLLSTTDVMSYIINKTDLPIGVYVYNANMKYVRFTDYIPELLSLDADEMAQMSSDYLRFKEYIRKLRSKPVAGEKNIYKLVSNSLTRFIRIEEAIHHHDVLGVVIDMTAEIEQRRRLESERDVDLLTGMLNRRGLKLTLAKLFKYPEELGHGAIFMIDADDLKKVNDTYGHSYGDRYLKALADVLHRFGSRQNISARLGGDEFVVFLYGYEDEKDLRQDIRAFVMLQDMISTVLEEGDEVMVRFSMGYALTYGQTDHSALLKEADDLMYENKRKRKGGREDDDEIPPLFR